MPKLSRGLYEVLITEVLEEQLTGLGAGLEAMREALRGPEAADRIALHVARIIERAIDAIGEGERTAVGVDLARRLIDIIRALPTAEDLAGERPIPSGEVLRSLISRLPDGRADIHHGTADSTVGYDASDERAGRAARGSPGTYGDTSADRIDVVMAFIRRSGIAPLMQALREHCAAGRALRVLTTSYTGSTEARALDELFEAGSDILVSMTRAERPHAKAWLLHRQSGFSTAYIGSSNLTTRHRSADLNGMCVCPVPAIRM